MTILLLVALCQAQSVEKPIYQVKYTPKESIISNAVAELEKAGLGPKYNVIQPFYIQTPSQMGNDFVGFTSGLAKPDTDGFVRLRCIIPVNSMSGATGKPEELWGDVKQIYVHLDEKGNVTGFKTMEPQQATAPYSEPATRSPQR